MESQSDAGIAKAWMYASIVAGSWWFAAGLGNGCFLRKWHVKPAWSEQEDTMEVDIGVETEPFSRMCVMRITANPTPNLFNRANAFVAEVQSFIVNRLYEETHVSVPTYSGSMSLGKRHGPGSVTYANGDTFRGTWHMGVIVDG
eukprot:gene33753-22886_t